MKKTRYSESQIIKVLKEVEGGRTVKAACREFLPRIHRLLKQLNTAQENAGHRPHYVFRDLEGHPCKQSGSQSHYQRKMGTAKIWQKRTCYGLEHGIGCGKSSSIKAYDILAA